MHAFQRGETGIHLDQKPGVPTRKCQGQHNPLNRKHVFIGLLFCDYWIVLLQHCLFFLSLVLPCKGEGAGSQEDQLCCALVSQLNKFADKETLIQFLRCFLLESNSSSVRWQAHCLALHIYRYICNINTPALLYCFA